MYNTSFCKHNGSYNYFMISRETIPAMLCPKKGLTFTHFGMEKFLNFTSFICSNNHWKGPSTFELHCSQNNFYKLVSHIICFI